MKVSFLGAFNTFSVYGQVRSRRLDALREETRSQFKAIKKPGSGTVFYLHIYQNQECVGLLTLCNEDTKELRLQHLTLMPEFQMCWVEQQVMLYAEVWALDNEYDHAIIFAHSLGIPFYIRLGYRKTGETTTENGRLCYKMRKKL